MTSERREAAELKQAAGDKLTHEEHRAVSYRCMVDPEHDVADYIGLMHTVQPDGAIIEPHRARICFECHLEQFQKAQAIPLDTSDRGLAACRIPADAPLPQRAGVAFTPAPTLTDLLKRFSPTEIEAALAAQG